MNDERNSTPQASLMVEKGIENVYLLSGGIEQFLEDFPEHVEGIDVPIPQKTIKAEAEAKKQAAKEKKVTKRH